MYFSPFFIITDIIFMIVFIILPILKKSIVNTLLYSVVTLGLNMAFGLLISILVLRIGKILSMIRTMIFLPYVISMASTAMIWLWIYEPGYGLLNSFITFFGGPVNSTTTLMHQIYIRGFVDYQFGYASAITVLMMVVVSIVTALNFRYGSQGQNTDLS